MTLTTAEISYVYGAFWIAGASGIFLVFRIINRLSVMHKVIYESLGGDESIRKKTLLTKFIFRREYTKLGDKTLTRLCDACFVATIAAVVLGACVFIVTPSSGVTFTLSK
jgi:hypothetical protein